MFNDGKLDIYHKESRITVSGQPFEVLRFYTTAFYGEISFTVDEYYAAKQAESEAVKRVRIHQDKSIGTKHVIIIDDIQYDVGRTFSTTVKGIAVTDITLEGVVKQYEFT